MARPKKTDTPEFDASTTTPAQAKIDRIKIFERRLQNPNGQTSAPIDLKDTSLVCRWVNSAIAADKVWRAKQQGWQPVRPEELADLDQVGGFVKSADGFVTRGDRGQEVLMSMPRTWRDKIAMAKTQENLKKMGDFSATKSDIASATAERFGDEAGNFIDKRVNIVGGVRDQYERVERADTVLE